MNLFRYVALPITWFASRNPPPEPPTRTPRRSPLARWIWTWSSIYALILREMRQVSGSVARYIWRLASEYSKKAVTLIYVDGCYEIWYAKEEDKFVLLIPNEEGIPFPNLMSARQELIRLQTEGIAQGRLPKSLVKGGCR